MNKHHIISRIKFKLILLLIFSFNFKGVSQTTNIFPASGNVGIGRTDPLHKLHLSTTEGNRGRFQFANKTIDLVSYGTSSEDYSNSQGIFMSGHDGLVMTGPNNHMRFITNNGTYSERMRILSNGNVGINTKNPTYLLSVNGTIGAKEVNVTTSGWPDYVFESGYHLQTLKEVNDYIQGNGHLPNMPSAKQVKEEGINLSEINVKLLEKIEELTLHLIRQQQEIDLLKKEIESEKD